MKIPKFLLISVGILMFHVPLWAQTTPPNPNPPPPGLPIDGWMGMALVIALLFGGYSTYHLARMQQSKEAKNKLNNPK